MVCNADVADNFVTQSVIGQTGNSCNFNGKNFYSFYTLIAQVKDSNTVYIPLDTMSSKTGCHISHLIHATITNRMECIRVPYEMYSNTEPTIQELHTRFVTRMTDVGKYLYNSKFRNALAYLYGNYTDFCKHNSIEPDKDMVQLYQNSINPDWVKQCKQEHRNMLKRCKEQ